MLVSHPPQAAADLLRDVAAGRAVFEHRTMAEARADDGQVLLALNEIFVGHASHQSARYVLEVDGASERQSSSGIIVATGTGATGWAASINGQRATPLALPAPAQRGLAWLVREAWPSELTQISLTAGLLEPPALLEVTSQLGADAVFGDGIEADRLQPDWGQRITVGVSGTALELAA